MNKDLYQKDECFGIVTDENGALKIIQKDNNDYNKCLKAEQLKRKKHQ